MALGGIMIIKVTSSRAGSFSLILGTDIHSNHSAREGQSPQESAVVRMVYALLAGCMCGGSQGCPSQCPHYNYFHL